METHIATSIDPIEVAFVRSGFDAALDVAAVKAVEAGALALEGRRLRVVDPSRATANDLIRAFVRAAGGAPNWKAARAEARLYGHGARELLERRLVAAGMLREPSPWRWLTGRCTPRGQQWLSAIALAYPAAQIVATDPALALAVHGPRALDGTRYYRATAEKGTSDGAGCGAPFGGHGGCGHGGGCGGGCGSG